mgnify:CR=1 FL=1
MTTPNLEQLGSFLDPFLAVPFRGKTYQVPAVSAETGLRLQKLVSAGIRAATEEELAHGHPHGPGDEHHH